MTWKQPPQCPSTNGRADAHPLARGVRCALCVGHGGRHEAQYPADNNDPNQTPWSTSWADVQAAE